MKKQYVQYGLNALIGIVFIVSAVLKIISIDAFELYIYSFDFVGLSLSAFAARCFVGAELVLGVGLLLNFYPRFFRICSLLLLLVFSLFLLYVLFFYGNEDNCHCFGDLIEINPLPSLIKNILLIIILIAAKNVEAFNFGRKKLLTILLSVVLFLSIFVVLPPDNWFGSQRNTEFNEDALTELLMDEDAVSQDLSSGVNILCFFGVGCRYCELAAKKLYLIRQNNPDLEMNLTGILWGKNERYQKFREETKLDYSQVYFIEPARFLEITNGRMPLVLVLKDGEVVQSLNYANIQEHSMIDILSE
ncbi:hypothetical protein D0T49_05600 [Paludibacter sp. 221]|uniref:MauE/DoxX family redox-associated membrane protein n=1 Tax=Paludibacter sp. 221 TaxID=2302939 RepID=UPI0013D6E5DA|nr:MauE/DoxX family redox-associated membrane protein [Paludibacter sp. 221]NDV46516.1 hypothetical protein [Paludibacter sp. 221]